MVILENVHVSKLKLENFKKFTCLCELCDCGCFERSKQKHHRDCKKNSSHLQTHKKTSHSSLGCTLSHYRDNFKANFNYRPPSACLPPRDNYTYKNVPMDLNTIQKLEFKQLPVTERTKSYKIEEKYIAPTEPFKAKSKYQDDFMPITNHSVDIVKKNANQATLIVPAKKFTAFVGKSTTTDHFRTHKPQAMARSYSEMPSYAGFALNPTNERNFTTTTSTIHKEFKNIPITRPFLKNENTSLVMDKGKMDFETVNRETYVKFKNAEKAQLVDPKANQSVISQPFPMKGISQTRHDYVYYANHRPPAPTVTDYNYDSNLNDIVYPGASHDLSTIYTTQFKGHDVRKNPKQKSCKIEPPAYEKPTEKVDGQTVTMRDYPGVDVTKVPKLNVIKAKPTLKNSLTPMDFQTTAQKHFVHYHVKPPQLAKDPIQQVYVAPKEKFLHTTTNSDNYYAKVAEKVYSLKPEINNLNLSGRMDFTSQYRDEYINHGLTMCEAKAYLIAQQQTQNANAPLIRI